MGLQRGTVDGIVRRQLLVMLADRKVVWWMREQYVALLHVRYTKKVTYILKSVLMLILVSLMKTNGAVT